MGKGSERNKPCHCGSGKKTKNCHTGDIKVSDLNPSRHDKPINFDRAMRDMSRSFGGGWDNCLDPMFAQQPQVSKYENLGWAIQRYVEAHNIPLKGVVVPKPPDIDKLDDQAWLVTKFEPAMQRDFFECDAGTGQQETVATVFEVSELLEYLNKVVVTLKEKVENGSNAHS